MIFIAAGKYVDWQKLRAEYVGSQTSYRKLAQKYKISANIVAKRGRAEGWQKDRKTASDEAAQKIVQKTASAVAENAVIAADMKRRLLLRLKRMEENYPYDATEVRHTEGENTVIYRLRDLTAALKELTDDLPKTTGEDKNAPVYELLRRLDGESGV